MISLLHPRRSLCSVSYLWARQLLSLVFFGAILLALTQGAFAQGYARITGVVTDPSGAAVKGATVTAAQVGTGEVSTATTNDEGLFVFPSLRPTQYNLKVTSAGFATYTKTGIVLQADAAVTENIALQVGNVDQTITVEASSAQVDTSTATLSQVVDQRRINDLPLNGRNAAALTTLVAGVVIAPNAQADQGLTKTFPVAVTITSNGTRANQTNYMLDGGNNVDEYTNVNAPFPFPDALQEFSVQTSNYSAEYGENAGGVVNIITKSGTNNLHGSGFGFLRNNVFNARNFFSPKVDQLKRAQFGGTFGGPVVIPNVYNGKDKTFFFFGYQGTTLRNLQGSTSAFVPTAANLAGDFSAVLDAASAANPLRKATTIIDPLNNQ